jgi:lipopolysaccharide transport system permease protein
LSAINVEYRDIRYIIPFLLQLLLFSSPVIYSSNFIPEKFQTAYGLLNPMSGIIEGFRWAILGTNSPNSLIYASAAIIFLILVSGLYFFKRREKAFADII